MASGLRLVDDERVLVSERNALVAWLGDLERRRTSDERVYERWVQVRRLVGKLDNRIRLIRDLAHAERDA
jgi:hypothetical protein